MLFFFPWNLLEFLSREENREAFLTHSTWLRPEEIKNYEDIVDGVKLATRTNRNPKKIIDAYIKGSYRGNILSLLEPDFSGLHSIENSELLTTDYQFRFHNTEIEDNAEVYSMQSYKVKIGLMPVRRDVANRPGIFNWEKAEVRGRNSVEYIKKNMIKENVKFIDIEGINDAGVLYNEKDATKVIGLFSEEKVDAIILINSYLEMRKYPPGLQRL